MVDIPATDGKLRLMSIGIDIGKDIFHIVGFDPNGKIDARDVDNPRE